MGKPVNRVDGPVKASGKAKFSQDVKRPGMLYGVILTSPYAHAKIRSVDTSAAEALTGVKSVRVISGPGSEIQWCGTEIAAVAAEREPRQAGW
jgi:CO/xanthine dehydrogenase Mo-binding subunit